MRFTLFYRKGNSSMRMDMGPGDGIDEILATAAEAWGCGGIVLRDGYEILDPRAEAGGSIAEGDLVEVLPDPFRGRCRDIPGRSGRPPECDRTKGRMGTRADVLFGPNAMAAIMEAADRSSGRGGLTGSVETDMNGSYRLVTGTGGAQVGMYFPSEGTAVTDAMVSELRAEMESGVIVVIDPAAGELAVYIADGDGSRLASALMSERRRTQIAWRRRISSSVMLPRSIISETMPSNRRRAESSKTVPRGAILLTSSPPGTSMTSDTSEVLTRGLPGSPVTQNILEPMRLAISAVWTTDDVLPV